MHQQPPLVGRRQNTPVSLARSVVDTASESKVGRTPVEESHVNDQSTSRAGQPVVPRPVVSRTSDISVITTERGLPTQLKIGAAEMSRAPEDLAEEILSLCRLSALRLQVARRRDLVTRGFSPAVIRGLNLATEEDLVPAEEAARGDDEELPETWMTSP
jgi:hypothetical protein